MKTRVTLLAAASLAVSSLAISAPPALAAEGDVSVADYGASVNDGTDDTDAIQAAINAAIAQNRARLLFDQGTYNISRALTVNDSSDLTIEGAVLPDGMPGTTLMAAVEYAVGNAGFQGYQGFDAYRNDNFTIKNFVGTADKTTAFYGTVSEVTSDSVTVTPYNPNYVLPSSYTVELTDLAVIDTDLGGQYRTIPFGGTRTFSNVPGTDDLRVTGLSARPNLHVGEVVGWEIIRVYGQGFIDAYDGTNATFENIQVTNWVSAPLAPRRIQGDLTMRRIFAVPTEEYLNAGAGGICICGNGGDIVLDQYQYFSGVAAEDALQQGPDLHLVESVSGNTVTVRSGGQSATNGAVRAGDTASFFKSDLADGVPTTATLASALNNDGSFTFTSLPPGVTVGSTFYFNKFKSKSFTVTNSDVYGRMYTLDDSVARNNNLTDYQMSTLVDSITFGGNTEGAYPQSVEITDNVFYSSGVGVIQKLTSTATNNAPMKDTSLTGNVFLNGTSASFEHVENVTVANNFTTSPGNIATFAPTVVNGQETGTTRLVPAGGTGLLPNGDFESGSLSPWTQTAGSGATTTTESGSTRLSLPAGYEVVKYTVTGLSPDTLYAFTGKAKDLGEDYATYARVSRFGSRDLLWSETRQIPANASGYSNFHIAFKTAPSRTSADLYLFRAGGSDIALFDDLAVERLIPAGSAGNNADQARATMAR